MYCISLFTDYNQSDYSKMTGRKESAYLSELIQSLTGSEKRYFKIYAARHARSGGNKYIALFNLIEAGKNTEKYTPAEMQKIGNYVPRIRQYLFELILKSLDTYHANSSVEIRLRKMLNMVDVFYSKGDNGLCHKMIRRAKSLAVHYDKYNFIHDIVRREIQLAERMNPKNTYALNMKLKQEQDAALESTRLFYLYKDLHKEMHLRSKLNSLKNTAVRFLQEHPLPPPPGKKYASDFKIPYAYIAMQFYRRYIEGNIQECYEVSQKILDLYHRFPHQQQEEKLNCITNYNNHAICCLQLEKYKEGFETLDSMRALAFKWPEYNWAVYQFYFPLVIQFYIQTGEMNRGRALAKEIEGFLKTSGDKTDAIFPLLMYYEISYYFFIATDYKMTLHYCNKILNGPVMEQRKDIRAYTMILKTVLHLELNNFQLLESGMQSAFHFFQKTGTLNRFIKSFPKFIKAITHADNKTERSKIYRQYKDEGEIIFKDPEEKKVLEEFFDFISWLQSKIENRPFAEVLMEKRREEKK